jgi:hypothetical protein
MRCSYQEEVRRAEQVPMFSTKRKSLPLVDVVKGVVQ